MCTNIFLKDDQSISQISNLSLIVLLLFNISVESLISSSEQIALKEQTLQTSYTYNTYLHYHSCYLFSVCNSEGQNRKHNTTIKQTFTLRVHGGLEFTDSVFTLEGIDIF